MFRIGTVIGSVLKKRGLNDHAQAALVVHRTQQWLDERLPALHSTIHVEKLSEGTLYIACIHSVALQECQSLRLDIQEYLKRDCPDCLIRDIRVVRQRSAA